MKTLAHRKLHQPRQVTRLFALGIAVIALLAGLWFFLQPQLDQQWMLHEQDRLLESITTGSGSIVLDPKVARVGPAFYIESAADAPQPLVEPIVSTAAEPDLITGIGVLTIDKIGLKLPVVDGVSKKKLKVAVGRVPQTAQIGASGNAVIAGHGSYAYGQYFNRLGELENGDVIAYQPKDGEPLSFEVYAIRTIRPGDQSAFAQPSDSAEITLYTCTPVRIASHRLLIHAKLITE